MEPRGADAGRVGFRPDRTGPRTGPGAKRLSGPALIVTHGVTSRFLRMAALGLTPADLNHVPGGQGVVFHLRNGQHATLAPNLLQPAVPEAKRAI